MINKLLLLNFLKTYKIYKNMIRHQLMDLNNHKDQIFVKFDQQKEAKINLNLVELVKYIQIQINYKI